MKLSKLLACALFAVCSSSFATVLDFNSPEQWWINNYSEDGFTVTRAFGDGMGVLAGGDGYWNTTGSSHLMTWTNIGSVSGFTLTKNGGGIFNLNSFMYGNGYVSGLWNPTSILVTGISGVNTITSSINIGSTGIYTYNFGSEWTNLTSVSFAANGLGNRSIFDNIVVDGPVQNNVPEPASLALIGLGLAGLGVAGRRKRKQ